MNPGLMPLLLAPWRQRDLDAPWSRRTFFAVAAAGLLLAVALLPGWPARLLLICCVLGCAVFGVWISLVASLLEQNHPHAARLVPGHLRRLRQAALAGWLPLSLALGPLLWGSLGQHFSLPFSLLAGASAAVFVAWALRVWQLWVVISFLPAFIAPALQPRWKPLWAGIGEYWQAQPWSVLALSLLLLAALLTRVFGRGDGTHQAGYQRRNCMRRAARQGAAGKPTGLRAFGRIGALVAMPFDAVYNAWLRQLLAHARPRPASVMARAEIVLHGQQHWLRQALASCVVIAMVAMGFGIAFALVGSHVRLAWQNGAIGMGIGLASAGFNPGFMLRNMLWQSRREQSLLALLPGMPQGAAQTRAVLSRQLRHFAVAWVVTSLGMLALAFKAGQPLLLCLPLAALPVGVLTLLRSPAGMRAPGPWTAVAPIFGMYALGGLLWVLAQQLQVPLWSLVLLSSAVTAALLVLRWRALGDARAALPAGRLT